MSSYTSDTPGTPSSLATSIYESSSSPSYHEAETKRAAERQAKWHFSTLAAALDTKDQYGASSTPIYQTATFKGVDGQYDYTRSGNPTRGGLESHLARLYGAYSTFALSTGMTCLDTILRLVKPGETVLAGDDLYGGTNRLLTYIGTHGGVDVRHLDTTRVEALEPHLGPDNKVRMVLLESPTNPLLKIADLTAIVALVKDRAPNALIVVDNTMMSPYLQRPLDIGCHIVYDSGTKYLSGHHDVMAGLIAVKDESVHKQIAFLINSIGSGLAPFDSFLLLRGVKTISLRMDRQMATTQLVAEYLDNLGFLVHYPGLKSHPQYETHWKQATGAGAVLSFVTGDKALSERIVGGTRLWGISVSFGAVNSLISMPCLMSHASISAAVRAERGLPENLIRLCVGIEDPRDLIDDLEASLLSAGAIQHNLAHSPMSSQEIAALYNESPAKWIEERSRAVKRPGQGEGEGASAIDRLVKGFNATFGLQGRTTGEQQGEGEGGRQLEEEVTVSAPGKVIMFGEHAVVHGVTAIAASVDLRCFSTLSPRSDSRVGLVSPNLDIDAEWRISELPWALVPAARALIPTPFPASGAKASSSIGAPAAATTPELDPTMLAALEKLAADYVGPSVPEAQVEKTGLSKTAQGATVAWLYLYMIIAGSKENAFSATFTASSNLPISAGLGSSAAYSTCIASSLLIAHSLIPSSPSSPSPSSSSTPLIDTYAFLSEKVLHGNPSGIDNAVSARGGAVAFSRPHAFNGHKGEMTPLGNFGAMRMLLVNTKVPRDTKVLVAGVGKLKEEEPEMVQRVLEKVQGITGRARGVLGGEVGRGEMIQVLEGLIRENHAHLVALRVSHPSLETIVAATARPPYSLSTKLTGAGGGGCAITLIPDAYPSEKLEELMSVLRGDGFEVYLTSLGGKGVSRLIKVNKGQREEGEGQGRGEGIGVPVREVLRRSKQGEGLGEWAEQGVWEAL